MNGHDFPEIFDPILDDDEPERIYAISARQESIIDAIAHALVNLLTDDDAFEQELARLEAEATGVN